VEFLLFQTLLARGLVVVAAVLVALAVLAQVVEPLVAQGRHLAFLAAASHTQAAAAVDNGTPLLDREAREVLAAAVTEEQTLFRPQGHLAR